jgi:hypothetical protein
MPMTPEVARARGKKAALARCVKNGERKPNDPEYVAAQRDLAAAKLESYIEKVVAAAPPLTPAQLAKLSAYFDVEEPPSPARTRNTQRGRRVRRSA